MNRPKVITFDCYDTLCEFPIEEVAQRILGPRAEGLDVEAFNRTYEEIRFATTSSGWMPYRDVLRQTLRETMERFGLPYRDEDGEAVVEAVRSFKPFPDVPPALERLRQGCKLAIITNSDDDIMAENVRRIGVPIDYVITAEQAKAYKPAPEIFAYALETIGVEPSELLHVAQGFEYDIMPGKALGWERIWINRYGKQGDPAYGPYGELPNLTPLPEMLGL
jgi:2-haloacid dehalogenase